MHRFDYLGFNKRKKKIGIKEQTDGGGVGGEAIVMLLLPGSRYTVMPFPFGVVDTIS